MKKQLIVFILAFALLLTGCNDPGGNRAPNKPNNPGGMSGANDSIGNDDTSFGEELEDTGVFDGMFEGETTENDMTITCLSGTAGCYSLSDSTLTFSGISEDTVYSIKGAFSGNIVIDVDDSYKFDLEMHGFSMISSEENPVTVLGGNEVSIKAKKDTVNYIYDLRDTVDEADTTLFSGTLYSTVDLEISGKGELNIVSENNKGIHSKKDLQVKNLTLKVYCTDNALKGNDSVSLENATVTLIATVGDGIKTTNTDISSKGNQRGTVSINGGSCTVYASCDGIDAAYDVVIDGAETVLNIYTDKYSNYSSDVTDTEQSVYYIRNTSNSYSYSVKYYNSDSDYLWENAAYHSSRTSGYSTYYYYAFPRHSEYSSIQFFIYTSDMEQGQEQSYYAKTDLMAQNANADTLAINSRWGSFYCEWTDYSATPSSNTGRPGGPPGGMGGGMNDGNTDKGDHSTKGIKAANAVTINDGTVNIKSYDDAIHANKDSTLENGESPLGSVTVNGGVISLYSNDDGLHAAGALVINGGTVSVLNSYEGTEGYTVTQTGGYLSIISSDDGINSTATSGTGITLSGGNLFIYCKGDGIDANSRDSYSGIVFSGVNAVIISNSMGNSAIDTEAGYSYTAGAVLAVMPTGGMSSEATKCQSFSSVGKTYNLSLTQGHYLTATIGGSTVTVRMPMSISAYVIILGSSSATASTSSGSSHGLEEGQVIWQ